MTSFKQGYSLALPPSPGRESIRRVALRAAEVLSDFGFSTIQPFRSYAELERALLTGEVHAAWAPPTVCARLQQRGARVPFRAIRFGATSYRSALLCRGERAIDIKRLGNYGAAVLRAAWVDHQSAAGYLMPRHYLRNRGVELESTFDEVLLGSYKACFEAVLEGEADLTASYVARRGSGYVDLCGSRAAELRILAWTDEISNDGIAVSPELSREQRYAVEDQLRCAFNDPTANELIAQAFDADGFDEPEQDAYDGVWDMLCEERYRQKSNSRLTPRASTATAGLTRTFSLAGGASLMKPV